MADLTPVEKSAFAIEAQNGLKYLADRSQVQRFYVGSVNACALSL